LHIDRNKLLVVQICRVCSDLAPAVHIDQIVAKAHQRALCCFVSRDLKFLARAFYDIRTATARVQ